MLNELIIANMTDDFAAIYSGIKVMIYQRDSWSELESSCKPNEDVELPKAA